ncbi:hypothetical protein Ahy_A05g025161 [Arachis hypogaea]|uniref:Uncharacterized protein n=1 Tax=Arachis hypogaea TaxID=3818 RepID=A0A445D7R1_ARAHY|nr:hypothetical protein Ahy_A05g025161 [Arachis hypogaea]
MKTLPNTEDMLDEVDSDEKLEVGMKFNTKMEFKEGVSEYCIQKKRRIWFKKNDNVSVDVEGNCWQIKTFINDHICPRETENILANKKWLACKLYFKSKFYLDLNKSSLTRVLGDTTTIVYGDAAAQYKMVSDYRLTLIKSYPDSTCRCVRWRNVVELDVKGNYWQIKTFINDHICPRETENILANKKWLACRLYFKSKFDLDLNKSSLTRVLGDATTIVYGDAAAQYGMVSDYGLTLIKSNPDSTVQIDVIPHPNSDENLRFENMCIYLEGCKRGFKTEMPCVYACAALAITDKRLD